jgi:ribonuclease P protein component
MLRKSQRLNLSLPQNRKIFREKHLSSKNLTLYFRNANQFKAAVVIPKKNVPLAVDRNQVRRILYIQIRQCEKLCANKEILILYRSPNSLREKDKRKMIEKELGELLKKANLF